MAQFWCSKINKNKIKKIIIEVGSNSESILGQIYLYDKIGEDFFFIFGWT